jgi:transposase
VYDLDGVRVEQLAIAGEVVTIEAVPTAAESRCSTCGQPSARVHSRSVRALRDLPCGRRQVRVRLTVRRFRCGAPACARHTFVEQVPGVTLPHRQAVQRLETLLGAFAAALGGQAGARLAGQAGMPVSGDSLLRLLARDEPVLKQAPRVLGVDDWAWRRGQRYGTILVDLEAGRPVDLLPDRTSAGLARWLREHPGVEVVARDRSTEYARGVAEGAPTAVQVLDRWHLHRNVREVAERVLERHPDQLRAVGAAPPDDAVPSPPRRSWREEARREGVRERAEERYAAIQRLAAEGLSQRAIAQRLDLARGTVRRYAYAGAVPERAAHARRPSMLAPHAAYLERRWAEGCRNGLQLWRELRERRYPGSRKLIALWVRARRTEPAPTTPHRHRPADEAAPVAPSLARRRPSARRLAWLLVRAPEDLHPGEQQRLACLEAACPDAAVAYPLIQQFVQMLRQSNAEPLDAWLATAEASGVPDMRTFAAGLREEVAALEAALRLPWSTGPVEGQITRLKLIKRQAYGRAGIDTLRRRVLRAA